MIGVVIPAHDEAATIGACLASIRRAAADPALGGEPVLVVVVLDDCRDGTERIVRGFGVATLALRARNVGIARARGAAWALAAGARWLAFTDADTTVSPDWLSAQLAQGADVVCGTVGVRWGADDILLARRHAVDYADRDGHRHVHGANLGVAATAYCAAGGFPPLASSEDVGLVRALERQDATIAWSARPRVLTSARREPRAPDGFGATLARLADIAGSPWRPPGNLPRTG